jgi:polyisoprenoid-binding protein YceI
MSHAATATTTGSLTGAWSIDPVHSRVEFEVDHLGVSPFRGQFKEYSGELVAGDPGELAIAGAVRADSVAIEGDLRQHLLSPDFFDAGTYPEIRFRSTAVELGEDGEVTVEGELTIREATETVSARGRIGEPGVNPTGDAVIGVRLETEVDRNDYGLGWNMELPNGRKALADEVRILVSLELVSKGS